MKNLKKEYSFIMLIVYNLVLSIYALINLPEIVPIHWNIRGEVDSYGHKQELVFLMISLILGIYLLMIFIPKVDPESRRYKIFNSSYQSIRFFILLTLTLIYSITVLAGLGFEFPIGKAILFCISVMFIGLGNVLGKIKQNYFVGVKTPWTLKSEHVWNKTHRFSGKIFVGAGVVSLFSLFFSESISFFVFMILILFVVGLPVIYSHLIFKKESSSKN